MPPGLTVSRLTLQSAASSSTVKLPHGRRTVGWKLRGVDDCSRAAFDHQLDLLRAFAIGHQHGIAGIDDDAGR